MAVDDSSTSRAATNTPVSGDVEAHVRTREALRYAAMERADVAALAGLLAEDLRYTHSDAGVDSKAEYLERVGDGTFDYGPIEYLVTSVTVIGDVALSFGEMRTVAQVRGRPKSVHNVGLSVWVAGSEGWRLVAYQPTAVPG